MSLKKRGGKEQQCTQRELGNFEEKCVQNRNCTAVNEKEKSILHHIKGYIYIIMIMLGED